MRVREGRAPYGRFVITVTGLLLTLGVRGVAWGLTQFLELDGNVRFTSLTGGGTCEDGTFTGCNCDITTGLQTGAPGAPCTSGVACTGGACVEFDWANGPDSAGICSPPTIGVPISCPPTSDNGLFDGGVFNGAQEPPSVPKYIGTDPTIPPGAHNFAADALGIATAVANACNQGPNFGLSCAVDADCTSPVVAGSCQFCGTGDPTVYTGQGSETNNDALGAMTYATATVPNKDDISNVYAIAHQDPFPPTGASTDISEIYAAFERVVNNGDSHVDLEFLQDSVTLSAPCKGTLQGERSAGDLLLSVDFTKGGISGLATLRTWQCNSPPTGPKQGICRGGANDGTPCDLQADCPQGRCGCDPIKSSKTTPAYPSTGVAISGLVGKQAVNAGTSVSCGGWACRNADGTAALICVNPGNKADGTACLTNGAPCGSGGTCELGLTMNEFYEAGINLKAAGFSGCINSFLPHTRSSQSFTAVLKDFTLLKFITCQSNITVTKSCTCAPSSAGDTINVSISGQVCNPSTSSESLTIDSPGLTNDQPGTTFTGCATGTTLAPGQCCNYTGTYSESSTCTPTDSVTVTATGALSGAKHSTTSDPAECSCGTRGITVDKSCTCAVNAAKTGIDVSFSGKVCNTGTLALSSVSVTDDQGGVTTPPSSTLAPGACSNYSGSYASTAANPCSNTDTVSATASSTICPQALTPATKTASCTCPVTPRISTTKCCFNHLVADSTGRLVDQVDFKGQVCAKDGSGTASDVQLTGVTLSNDKGGVTTSPSSTLAPGACSSYSGTYFPTDPSTCTATDTVTASGGGICSTNASNMATASCTICSSTPCP